MKISMHWLNSYLDQPADADEVERLLTDQGLPIEMRDAVNDGSGDEMLDVEVTSNRSDCLSHIGLAREVAAGIGRAAIGSQCSLDGLVCEGEVGSLTSVTNEDEQGCPLYTARVIRGVKVGPSPDWLVRRLESVGLRSVNNLADITNFVLMELGQPLHVFDMDRLSGRRIVVRGARRGESFLAIDGSQHKLGDGMLVIADGQKPVAVAGVMGAMDSRVTEQTTEVLLESAVFDPLSVRRTSRALKLASDSSYRFERGVDPLGVNLASCRAARLIVELAGGALTQGAIRVGFDPPQPLRVTLRPRRCNEMLGLALESGRMVDLLGRLGFDPRLEDGGDRIACTVPTYRLDIQREVDLIEEVARLEGFDSIPVNTKIHIVARPAQPAVEARKKLGQVLVAHGYHEAITFSFAGSKAAGPFVPDGAQAVEIASDHRRSESVLRPSVLPSLLACRKSNQDVGNTGVRLFECAAIWAQKDDQITEGNRLALLADAEDAQKCLRGVRGMIDELVSQLAGDKTVAFVPSESANYSIAAKVQLAGQDAGCVGLIAPGIQKLFELQVPVVAGELDLDVLLSAYPPSRVVTQLPRYPGIERDLSIIVQEKIQWEQIEQEVLATEPALLEALRFIGVYRGKPIPRGQKSVSFRLRFRDPDRTLRHEQVDPQMNAVVERLKKRLDAQLRV